jgi:hypothetical protein
MALVGELYSTPPLSSTLDKLAVAPVLAKLHSGESCDVLRWSQTAIDVADGDPYKGSFLVASPLAVAFATWLLPVIGWVVPDGMTTCATAKPWPAALTPVAVTSARARLVGR